jgi:Sulfotransferase domain
MTLRERVPPTVQPLVREAYLRAGMATSRWRMTPEFMLVGSHRCGTTSLFKALASHPQIQRPPVNKGTDYYSLHSYRSRAWYLGHFPIEPVGRSRAGAWGPPVAFEACTYYMFHPFALEKIRRDLPSTKLVIVLRDPVERAFSAYKHEIGRGFEWETDFERALDLEGDRLIGEVDRMRSDPTYESFAHRHHAYVRRGEYAGQLARAYEHFPAEQVHVMELENFIADPDKEYTRLTEFLGVSRYLPAQFDRLNARPSAPMPSLVRRRLEAHFRPHDADLADLLGREPAWRQQ